MNTFRLILTEAWLQATSLDWIHIVAIAIAVIHSVTYLTTSMLSALAVRSSKQNGKRPPILPYWIPFIGNLIDYFRDGPQLAAKMVDRYGLSVPAGLRLGNRRIYLLGDPNHVSVFFKQSAAVSSTIGAALAVQALFGMPDHIVPLYRDDDSGQLLKPLPGSQVQPEKRIKYFHTKATHQHLAGASGIKLGERYIDILSRNMSTDTSLEYQWVELPDLWLFVRDLVFNASIEAMCGSFILSLNPTLGEDFWAFHESIPTLLRGLPRWLCPAAYKSRDRMLSNVKKWHAFANEHSDLSDTAPDDRDWDQYLGFRYVRARQIFLRNIEVMDADGRASEDLGLLFAANTNSAPVAYWTIFEVFSRPHLLSRVRDIAQTVHQTRGQKPESANFGSNPLLQSIFAEVTRLRVVGIIPRYTTNDLQLGEWSIPQGSIIGLPSRAGAMNKNVWNAGTTANPHPLETFWEDRFLIYPNDPNSGPLRKQESACHPDKQETTAVSPSPETISSEPIFSLKGLKGAYTAFGGGVGLCPGRQFAKQEVISTLLKLALEYDVELQMPRGWEPKMDHSFFPLGTLPPKTEVPFRIRRRLV